MSHMKVYILYYHLSTEQENIIQSMNHLGLEKVTFMANTDHHHEGVANKESIWTQRKFKLRVSSRDLVLQMAVSIAFHVLVCQVFLFHVVRKENTS